MLLLHLILFLCCIVRHISHICKRTGQRFPEDGQIFYMRERHGKDAPVDEWKYNDIPENEYECSGGDGFLKLTELVGSGKYKWKWHDCKDGTVVFEWKGDGSSGWFEGVPGTCMQRYPYDPCSSSKIRKNSKSDIALDVGRWNWYDIYIPPVCSTMRPIDTHCNCRGTSVTYEFSQTIGISKTNGNNQGLTGSVRSEIQVGIKATAKVGLPFVGGGEVEASAQTTFGAEIGASFLTSSSTTWNKKNDKNDSNNNSWWKMYNSVSSSCLLW